MQSPTYDGHTCGSAAAKDRDYCTYHLRNRARLLHMAQHRARNERFDLKFPPLESMHAVQSALTQLAQALAADMIDLKRADKLLAVLRLASRNLLKSDKWPAGIAHSDQPGPAVDLTAEYGLPEGIDLDAPPEVAFPPPEPVLSGAPPLSPSFGDRVGTSDDLRTPYVDDDFTFRPDFPVTPEYVELDEIRGTQGDDAVLARSTQMMRDEQRRAFHSERKRYAAIAAKINLQRPAERLAEQRLAAQRAAAQNASPVSDAAGKKPPAAAGEAFAAKKEEAIA